MKMTRKKTARLLGACFFLILFSLSAWATSTLDKIDLETSAGQQVDALEKAMQENKFVLLLHGARFSSADWERIGTLEKIREMGFTPVAVNLNKSETLWSESPERWMQKKVDGLMGKVVIVSPSMSGKGSLPYVISNPASVLGYIPIAPVSPFPSNKLSAFRNIQVKSLIMFGSGDEYGKRISEQLKGVFADPKVVAVPGAGHACYLDKPDVWHRELQAFLKSL